MNSSQTKAFSVQGLVRGAVVCALYIVITYLMASVNLAVGPVQFRLSEMFNFLAFYNKRYLWAVTLGCAISNVLVPGNLGIIDFVVGGGSTFIFISLGILLTKKLSKMTYFNGWLNVRFIAFSVFFALSMFTIALELMIFVKTPFWVMYPTLVLGEFASLIIGMFIIITLSKRIDLSR